LFKVIHILLYGQCTVLPASGKEEEDLGRLLPRILALVSEHPLYSCPFYLYINIILIANNMWSNCFFFFLTDR